MISIYDMQKGAKGWFILGLVLSIVVNLVLGFLLFKKDTGTTQQLTSNETDNTPSYPFLSQRIFIENKNDILINFMPLRQSLKEYIGKQKANISLYFEYLPSGSSIGINDTQEIQMASLLKVPIVMSIYGKIEKKEISKDRILIMTEGDVDQKYGTFWKEGVGAKISVEEAIKKTLIDSDNTTQRMLYRLLTPEDELKLHNELDARMETVGTQTVPYISAKSYSSFLRSLYLSSFLSLDSSQEILSIMTRSVFDEGLESGVDDGIPVAHKTGNIEITGKDMIENDCGIIYVPKRPYILCVFVTEGTQEEALAHIRFISKMIFGYVRKINGGGA